MAYREVPRMEIGELIRRWQAGQSRRQIAESTGLSRDTVAKYLATAESEGIARDGPVPSEEQLSRLAAIGQVGPRRVVTPTDDLLKPWADQVYQWLTGDRLQLTRIHELLAARGCQVSYQSLRRFIIRRNWTRLGSTTVRMEDTPPGEVAEVDFGRLGLVPDPATGKRKLVWAMIVVLCHSRHCFLWPMHQQTLPEVIAGLEAAWAFFGGVPRYLVLDNFPAAVVGPDSLNPALTRSFLEYAQRRGFFADPARVRHPKDKPKVERGVPYARERFFKGASFDSLAHIRAEAPGWCREVAGTRVHGTTRRQPLQVFQDEERHTLLPWDGEPYEIAHWRTLKVHPDHHVQCQQALYSVPSDLCPPGQRVEVRADSKLVHVYYKGRLIKVHLRQPRGGRATDPKDYPARIGPYTTRAPDQLKREAARLGPAVAEFAQRLLADPLPWAKLRQGHKLLRLAERYSGPRLDAACRRALDVDLVDVRRLERILVQALEEETSPQLPLPAPAGRFARPGSVFAHSANRQFHPKEVITHVQDH
ncbi:MAG: IS21 family transposase [Chloroflexi bacterium]|nr:IS21 family transposase [Chloroflexota bacterium]